jgi:hypothetical protein
VPLRDEVRRDREQSSAAFERVVWPVVQKQCGELRGSALRLVEGQANERIAYELDVCAGIDAYQRTSYGLRGIGSRVQWGINYYTFTVRVSRPSGALTEYRKRLITLKRRHEGFLYPYWTIQSYISEPGENGTLLAVGVAKTVELYQYIELHSFCPETCTLASNPAQWDMRFLEKPFHTLHTGM